MALTEWSVANDSQPIQVPDYTCGAYSNNAPVDLDLQSGGTTRVRVNIVNKEEKKHQQRVEH